MKKLFASLLLAGAALSANAALFISNNTTCEAVLILKAHDGNNPGSCYYYSSRFPVAASSSIAFNTVASANYPGGPGWYPFSGGGNATLIAAGSGFDAVTIYYGDMFGAINFNLGSTGSCTPAGSFSGSYPGCSFTNATWTNIGGGNVLLDLN